MPEVRLERNQFVAILLISTARTVEPARRADGTSAATLVAWRAAAAKRASFWDRRHEGVQGGSTVKLAASQQLFSYWNALRGARAAPERNDIDPSAISGVLSDTFILEFDRSAQFPLRIVGSRTNAFFGRDLHGAPFLPLWRAGDRDEIGRILSSVADEAQPFLLGGVGGPIGIETIDVETLLLPLRHKGATHSRILGSFAPRRSPEWLGLLPVGGLALTTLRALSRDSAPEASQNTFAGHARDEASRRGHLFVYRGGR
jgi:hypothetical protein